MKVTLHPDADDELQAAAQWYEDRGGGLGERFLAQAIDALTEIEKHPRRFTRTKHRGARDSQADVRPLPVLDQLRIDGDVMRGHCRGACST